MKRFWIALWFCGALAAPAGAGSKSFLNWKDLRNPVLSYPHWSIKDCAMAWRDGTFYVFFSAFYLDHGRVRSHVVEVSTKNFKIYSNPIFNFDGEKAGWVGMCSPDVQKLGNSWELSFNSWGDDPKRPDQPFYMTSRDLVHWSRRHRLATNLTAGRRVIDLSVTRTGQGYYAVWRQGREGNARRIHPRFAAARKLSGPWHFVGSGYVELRMADGKENGMIHENYEFLRIGGVLHMLSNDYLGNAGGEYLYTLLNPAQPLLWGKGFELAIPDQSFNRMVRCTAAALYDWRKRDGYFYFLYAGRNEERTYLHRGWNRLGLARSKDLIHWIPAGDHD
jgi:hypothetical protein